MTNQIDETPGDPASPVREVIPLSAHATSAKLLISVSPTRSVCPISVHVKEPDGTAWRVITVIVDGTVCGDPPYPACRGHCWIDLEVECPHDHPPTEAKPTELRGVVLCEASDLPMGAGDSERDRQWAKDFRKPRGARKMPNGEWDTTFRGDASPIQDDDPEREEKTAADNQGEIITDQQIQSFAQAFVNGVYCDRTGFDQEQALLVMRAILRRIVGEQITAIECFGGIGDWSRNKLGTLLSDAAEIELTQVFGAFSQAFASAMNAHAGPTAEPTSC
jgi:hypothetical protein